MKQGDNKRCWKTKIYNNFKLLLVFKDTQMFEIGNGDTLG